MCVAHALSSLPELRPPLLPLAIPCVSRRLLAFHGTVGFYIERPRLPSAPRAPVYCCSDHAYKDAHLPQTCVAGRVGDREIFKLVSYSATPDQWKEWLRVPLEHAAAQGNRDLFYKLLQAGADGSAGWRGCRDRSLIDAAAVGGNMEVVSGLLEAGAQPDVQVVSCWSKRSALYTATMLGHEDVARRLVIEGADVNFEDPVRKRTVLAEASWAGYEQLVGDMLLSGASPSCRDGDDGTSPLHIAAYGGFNRIVSTLLLRGADKDALDCEGQTPLMWASSRGRLSVMKSLLAAGADTSIRDIDGLSALDCAAEEGNGDIVEAMVEHGADVNACDDDGFTALHAAAEHDQAGAVDALIKAGADVEFKKNHGLTPLAIAAHNTGCKAMHALFQHGAQVDVRDDEGNTPLHGACSERWVGLERAVDVLLRWGADETTLNHNGASPSELLDVRYDKDGVKNCAPQDEIDRTRLLLSRAPANRAWRRRGWLVMLRSRDSKAREGKCSSSGNHDHDDGGEVGGSKVARIERVAGVDYDGPRTTSNGAGGEVEAGGGEDVQEVAVRLLGRAMESMLVHTASNDGCGVGADGGEEGSRLEVLLLLGLGLEGVFRTILGFL